MNPHLYKKRKGGPATRLLTLIAWLTLASALAGAQVDVRSFEGMSASKVSSAGLDVDPNGAVGTKQYLEWVNAAFQGYDKKTFAPVYASPVSGDAPFVRNGLKQCTGNAGDGVVLFDHLASRWIIGRRVGKDSFHYCIAVSRSDDLKAKNFAWRTYQLDLDALLGRNTQGHIYIPDYPKIATWSDAYYVSFDLTDPDKFYRAVGVLVCAFDRANMLTGAAARTPQCFHFPATPSSLFLGHTLLPADIDGMNPPPPGAPEAFVSIENPDSGSVSHTLNWWTLHVDWTTPANSKFSGPTPVQVSAYTPACYVEKNPADTACVPEPSSNSTHTYLDSVGDRLMHRFAYRHFMRPSERESYLVAQTVQIGNGERSRTGIRWYEFDKSGHVGASGTIDGGDSNYRFMPSMAQDKIGNAAAGYSVSGTALHPSIRASYFQLPRGSPTEINIVAGGGDQESASQWGDYTSMTVDPVDDCTFWYVNEYYDRNQTGKNPDWRTRIASFKLPACR
jgi:hypothetical protein